VIDYNTLAMGVCIGLFVGWIISMLWYRMTRLRVETLFARITRAQYVAFVDDLNEGRKEIIPIAIAKEGVYFSLEPNYPLIILVPPGVQPTYSSLLGKPVIDVVSGRLYGFAIDKKVLASLGIASVSFKVSAWECSENIIECVDRLIYELYKYIEKGGSSEIVINPDIRIGIAYRIPTIIKNMVSLLNYFVYATLTGFQEVVKGVDEFVKYQQRRLALLVGQRTQLLRWLLIFLLVGGIIGLMFMIFGAQLPKTSFPHMR